MRSPCQRVKFTCESRKLVSEAHNRQETPLSDPKRRSDRFAVYGVASLPLGTPVELGVIFEVAEEGRAMEHSCVGAFALDTAADEIAALVRGFVGSSR